MRTQPRSGSSRLVFGLVATALTAVVAAGVGAAAQARREFDVVARQYAFDVSGSSSAEIRVMQNDLVRIALTSADIPHSFTIEEAPDRIMRRVERGKPVSFDFRADQPGRFRFFCSLAADPKCKDMHGTLVVEKR